MSSNPLEYRRPSCGVRVRYRHAPYREPERAYLHRLAQETDFGGLFLATPKPFRPGSVVCLEILAPGDGGLPVHARAVVQWCRRWRDPRGMAVRFVDFDGLGRRPFRHWLESLLSGEVISPWSSKLTFPRFGTLIRIPDHGVLAGARRKVPET